MFTVFINGKKYEEEKVGTDMTLLTYLRGKGLTGTKLGCAEGGCGACTVVVSHYNVAASKVINYSVNACLAPLMSVAYKHVITIEGLGNSASPHEIQVTVNLIKKRIAYGFASQCGFCTPGIVMSLYALLRNNPYPSEVEIEHCFDGNLCRCTGYRPIIDAAKTFSISQSQFLCGKGKNCCRNNNSESENGITCGKKDGSCGQSIENQNGIISKGKGDIIFPPELKLLAIKNNMEDFQFENNGNLWIAPKTVESLLKFKKLHLDAKFVAGNSEVGIEIKFKSKEFKVQIYTMNIQETKYFKVEEDYIEIGSGLSLADLQSSLSTVEFKKGEEHKKRTVNAILDNLKWFAGRQIRNVASWAGNVYTASPISDLNPVWLTLGCSLLVKSTAFIERRIEFDDLFLGYRSTAIAANEFIVSIKIPFNKPNEFIKSYKVAKRKDDDIAIVNCCLKIELDNSQTIKLAKFSFGGVSAVIMRSKHLENYIIGKNIKELNIENMNLTEIAQRDFNLVYSSPGGMVEYRLAMISSFLVKFFNEYDIAEKETEKFMVNKQSYPQSMMTYVGQPMTHLSALKQATGEAIYVDDIPKYANELYGGLILSTIPHGKIINIDFSAALALDEVVDVITWKDVKGSNIIGPVAKDEELFASETIHFSGQLIALIIAKNQKIAQRASKLVKVQYETLPHILTIQEAIEKDFFFSKPTVIKHGNIEAGFQSSEHILEGEVFLGGQEHFYFETQCSLVVPKKEDDEYEIFSSTQSPTETQHIVSRVLGVDSNRIVCRVKRLGGGFGGKETRTSFLASALAVAASKYGMPIRCMLDRDEDMVITGQRHPFLGKYKVGFNSDGKLMAYDLQLFANAGYSLDLSMAVVERGCTHALNAYYCPNVKIVGKACKTNIHTNTAFRGFGAPQGNFICESILASIADYLDISNEQIREVNLFKSNLRTHYNQLVLDVPLNNMWRQLVKSSNFEERKRAIETFNLSSKFKKKGISIVPTMFGISFTVKFLNQAGALIHIYTDGSVLLTHGGTEMGQGLHTKMIQIAAEALSIPMKQIHISETSTNTVANTSATAASVSSDLNGMAVLDACQQINERLAPLKKRMPNASFNEIVKTAYLERINLSANGFYSTPNIEYDWEHNEGRLFNYYTYGVAVSEVEVDCLTGEYNLMQTDLLMDLGQSLNPAIDIGQIEGAFVQGLGLFTIEQTLFTPSGQLFTRGPGTYKIPSLLDIPKAFNVSLLENSKNDKAIHSSKAVGEPPLFLSASALFAIREAIKSYRLQNNCSLSFVLNSPATVERVRLLCQDSIIEKASIEKKGKPFVLQV